MKLKFERLSTLASQAASASSRGYSLVQQQLSEAGASALEAGKSVRDSLSDTVEQLDTYEAAARTRELMQSAATETQKLKSHFVDIARKADANYKEVADGIETVSMGLGITAGVTAAGAAIAAPTGLSAVGVALGVTSAPLIVAAAPVVAAAATVAGVVSGGAYFYSKWKSHNAQDTEDNSIPRPEAGEPPAQTEQPS